MCRNRPRLREWPGIFLASFLGKNFKRQATLRLPIFENTVVTDDGEYVLFEPIGPDTLTIESDFGGRFEFRGDPEEWIQIFPSNLRSEEPLRFAYSKSGMTLGLSVGIHPETNESIVHEGKAKHGRYLRIEKIPASVAGRANGPTTETVIARPDIDIDSRTFERALMLVADVMQQRSKERRPVDLSGVAVPVRLVKRFGRI